MPPVQRNAFTAEMRAAGFDWRLTVYGGALHGFHHPPVDHPVVPGVGYHPRPRSEPGATASTCSPRACPWRRIWGVTQVSRLTPATDSPLPSSPHSRTEFGRMLGRGNVFATADVDVGFTAPEPPPRSPRPAACPAGRRGEVYASTAAVSGGLGGVTTESVTDLGSGGALRLPGIAKSSGAARPHQGPGAPPNLRPVAPRRRAPGDDALEDGLRVRRSGRILRSEHCRSPPPRRWCDPAETRPGPD